MLRRLDYRPYPFAIKDANFKFILDSERTLVRTELAVERKPDAKKDEPFVLNLGEKVKIIGISIDYRILNPDAYERNGDELIFKDLPDTFRFASFVEISPEENKTGEGLYITDGMFCTQCEAHGFRKMMPYPDRPDVLAPMTTTIIADKKYPVLLSNGVLVEKGDKPRDKHFATWKDPAAKPCYIFALVAGNLAVMEDEFITADGRKVALRLYSDNDETLATCRFAMDSLKKAMKWDEEVFGRIYDLDLYMIVAVSKFNMGAMENRGLNVFNLKYVSGDRFTATDQQLIVIESVIAHEYFHNWSGNLVTVRDWFQLSLKEGFTVMRDSEFSHDLWGFAALIDQVRGLREIQFKEDAGPLAHPIRPDETEEVDNFYTATVYEKGAEVVRMQKVILGPALFRKGTDLYFSRHYGMPATCDDFVQAMKDASGIDLEQFKRWYSQAGTPTVHIRSEYDSKKHTLTFYVKQTKKEPFHIPLRIGLLNSRGVDLDGILHVKKAEEKFIFEGVTEKPVLSLNRSFSAPVKVDYPYTMKELCFLMRRDTDKFNRWDAGQEAAKRIILSMICEIEEVVDSFDFYDMLSELIHEYMQGRVPADLFAEMLVLPSEEAIANECKVVDPDIIHGARENLKLMIAVLNHGAFEELYKTHSEPYKFDPEHVARRAIKNACLDYLSYMEPENRTKEQFENADNMTDERAALEALIRHCQKASAKALQLFFDKHKNNRNIIDGWFALQAMSPMTDTNVIMRLMQHPEFSLKIPNRVYSVVRAFSEKNPTQFHHLSGEGYRLLADVVIELDEFNPQVAARIIEPLSEWKRYGENRQIMIKKELERIKNARGEKLSAGVKEKIRKSLEQ